MRPAILVLLLAVTASGGCTHSQLRRSTLNQARTITEIEYDQVLTNLAMVQANPDMLPYFAVVGTGGTGVTDQATVNTELEWDPTTLARKLLGLNASRQVEEQWTLAPVVNPDKLRALHAAYQLVLCGKATDAEADKLLKAFLGDDYTDWLRQGWLHTGSKKDVPKDACFVGRYGHCAVWVTAEGIDGLTRLTIATLNIATLDPTTPAAQPTQTVKTYTYTTDGKVETAATVTR